MQLRAATAGAPPEPRRRRGRQPFLSAEFDLPAPPSTNNLFLNIGGRGGRIKSPGYRSWIKEAGWQLRLSHPTKIMNTVAVSAALGLASRRPDVDNCLKALLDLLVTHEVIEDDAQVVELSVRVDRCVPAGRAHILVRQTLPPQHRMSPEGRAKLSAERRGKCGTEWRAA
jgi:Holliday junction resolvase RusA-like endonuclease